MYEKLLEKSRQALYVTMDRLQLTPDHVSKIIIKLSCVCIYMYKYAVSYKSIC